MKKFFKSLAVLLALTLIVGTIPASAAESVSLSKKSKIIYVGGSQGTKEDGTKCTSKKYVNVKKLLENYTSGDIKLTSDKTSVAKVSKKYPTCVFAKGIGTAMVTVKVDKKSVGTLKVIVKKNASNDTFKVTEPDAAEIKTGETYTYTLPRKGIDTDVRKLVAVGDNAADVTIVESAARVFDVTFAKAGTYTLRASAYQSTFFTGETAAKEINVTVTSDFAAEITGVTTITATGTFTAETKFSVKRGAAECLDKAVVNADGTATLTLTSKIRAAEYVVSDGNNEVTLTAEDERVDRIIIEEKGGQVDTGKNGAGKTIYAYVHYDVKNQYDESVRKSYSPKWTVSRGTFAQDAENGILTITDSTNEFKYNDFLSVTAVYTKGTNACTETATMNIGFDAAVGKIDVKGICQDGKIPSSVDKLLTSVPANFQSNEYALIFSLLDAHDRAMEWDFTAADEALSFTSKNPVIAQYDTITGIQEVTIEGVTYGAMPILRGTFADQGGDVETLVVSSRNGLQTNYILKVDSAQELATFEFQTPSEIIAENETVELDFTALDKNGEEIKDFRVLYEAITVSDRLWIEENDDRTFSLYFAANAEEGANVDVDALVSVNTIVPTAGGNVCIQMISVKDRAFRDAVKSYHGSTVFVEGDTFNVLIDDDSDNYIDFVDQYGRTYDPDTGIDFLRNDGYSGSNLILTDAVPVVRTNDDSIISINTADYLVDGDKHYQYLETADFTAEGCTDDSKDVVLEFAIAAYDTNGNKVIIPGSVKKVTFTVVDITKVNSLALSVDYAKLQNTTTLSTGVAATKYHDNTASVSGKFNGVDVNVPVGYVTEWTWKASGVSTATITGAAMNTYVADILFNTDKGDKDNMVVGENFWDYSKIKSDATYGTKAATITVKAAIPGKSVASASFTVGVEEVTAVSYKTKSTAFVKWIDSENAVLHAIDGEISKANLITGLKSILNNYDRADNAIFNVANANVEIIDYTTAGDNLYKVDGLDSVFSFEIGDTFTCRYSQDGISLTVKFTVGADQNAYIDQASNDRPMR